jgi:uncharacterized OsmC-like protein
MLTNSRLSYTVTARNLSAGVSEAAAVGKTATVVFDTSAGQSTTLVGPAELLLTAFAACILKSMTRFSDLQPFAYASASIEVEGEREDRPPRLVHLRYTLRVVTTEPEHRLSLLHRNIVQFGTIYNTLAATCDIAGEIVAVDPATGQETVGANTAELRAERPGLATAVAGGCEG